MSVAPIPENHRPSSASSDPQAVRIQLQKVLSSPEFAGAPRLRRFLDFVVTQRIEGKTEELKESVIGVEVFEEPDFDPKSHTAVRTAASRVRKALGKYYAGSGKDDGLLISLPSGRYVPEFALVSKQAEAESKLSRWPRWQPGAKHVAVLLCTVALITVGSVFVLRVRGGSVVGAVPQVHWGRILAKATAEGGRPKVIALNEIAEFLAAGPDEKQVYATAVDSRTLTVISTKDDTAKALSLPQDGGPLAISPDGNQLYIASRIGGIMVLDTKSDLHLVRVVPTAGPVWDLALAPDGRKLYVAMSHLGVWRFLTSDWAARRITNLGCPENLKVASDGQTLVVVYQCGGPRGGDGHDSVELYDTRTEELVGALALDDQPFVGGSASFSPDGQWILLDGLDACISSFYKHQHCPSAPSRVFHFVRVQDRQIVKSIGLPLDTESAQFIDPARVLVIGRGLNVVSATMYKPLENWQPTDPVPGEPAWSFNAAVLLPSRRRAYFHDSIRAEIISLEAENIDCLTPLNGVVASYTGDGVLTDVAGESTLSALGGVHFVPGRVGQAFGFDGVSGHLVAHPSGHYRFGYRDSSFALYAKFASLEGTMSILDRRTRDSRPSAHLAKTPDNHLIFDFARAGGEQLHLKSRTQVLADRWYHIAVAKDGQRVSLYVDGVLEDRQELTAEPPVELSPIYFGATWDGKAFLDGKLDEIAFYDRALTADQVHDLYQKRESGACRM